VFREQWFKNASEKAIRNFSSLYFLNKALKSGNSFPNKLRYDIQRTSVGSRLLLLTDKNISSIGTLNRCISSAILNNDQPPHLLLVRITCSKIIETIFVVGRILHQHLPRLDKSLKFYFISPYQLIWKRGSFPSRFWLWKTKIFLFS